MATSRTYKEITVSAYFMTDDAALAIRIAEAVQRLATGFALEGEVETAVKVGTCPVGDDDLT